MKKKLIIAVIAAIVVIGGGIGGYVYHSNQVKAEKMANYKKALSDYRFNSNRLIYSLDFVATDFIINWNSAIMNKKAMDAKNEIIPCSDFEDAVSSRYAFYDKYGAYKILDSVYVSLGKHLEMMRANGNEEQQKIVESCSKEYRELNNAIVLVKSLMAHWCNILNRKETCSLNFMLLIANWLKFPHWKKIRAMREQKQ